MLLGRAFFFFAVVLLHFVCATFMHFHCWPTTIEPCVRVHGRWPCASVCVGACGGRCWAGRVGGLQNYCYVYLVVVDNNFVRWRRNEHRIPANKR